MAYAGGPLGKYSQVVAAFLASVIVLAALILHGIAQADSFIDNIALIAIGAVFGAAASTSVNGKDIEAAHRRLDLLSAPPAQYLELHPEATMPAAAVAAAGPGGQTTTTTTTTHTTPDGRAEADQ